MITFAALKNIDTGERTAWGLRGDKSPGEQPPEEGTTVTATRKSGETTEVVMGKVVAQGDDWWLAEKGRKLDTRPPGMQQANDHMQHQHDPNSSNYTERRFAREEAADREEDAARLADRDGGPPDLVQPFNPKTTPDDSAAEFNWDD